MKRKVLKLFKVLGIIIGVLMMGFLVLFLMFNEPLPEGEKGGAADALAEKMLVAIDKSAWDSTGVVEWSFTGSHHFLWDKKRNWVRVQWSNNEVFVILDELTGVAFRNGKKLEGNKADRLVKKAWSFFANDSFWLNAPSKVFDSGTERRLVKMDDGEEALLITYASGGVTPGDSYLWILDENGLPKSWKMWVKVIPIGGVETTWDSWKTTETGAKIAQGHHFSERINIEIKDVKTATDLKTFGLAKDPFLVLE
jgi:hypothetical protein